MQSDLRASTVWVIRAITYVAYAFLLVSQFILLQGFLLKLLGADPSADYTRWAYRSLERVMEPFRGIFTPIEIDGNAVLDTSIMFAMVIYGIAIIAVRVFLDWLTFRLEKLNLERERELAMAATPVPPTVPGPAAAVPVPAPGDEPTDDPGPV